MADKLLAGSSWCAVMAALIMGGSGCTKQDDYGRLLTADFEDQPSGSKGISSEQAHSGRLAAVATGPTDTLVLRYPASVLGMEQRVRFNTQIWLAHSPNNYPDLLVQVWHAGSPIYTKGLRLKEVVWRYDRWVPLSLLLQLPSVEAKDELRVTLHLDQPATKAYLDDITLENAH